MHAKTPPHIVDAIRRLAEARLSAVEIAGRLELQPQLVRLIARREAMSLRDGRRAIAGLTFDDMDEPPSAEDLRAELVEDIWALRVEGWTYAEIAAETELAVHAVRYICEAQQHATQREPAIE